MFICQCVGTSTQQDYKMLNMCFDVFIYFKITTPTSQEYCDYPGTLLQGRRQDTTLLRVNLVEGKHLQGTCKSTTQLHMLYLKSSSGNST